MSKIIALAGNPNSGKTTLFNGLTGATAYVGNWPGVTVEQRKGKYKKGGLEAEIVDLPGIYSLSPYTPEEVISRNFILNEKPDAVINIIDGTNYERNLYLTTQLLEMDVPVIVALNMTDVLEKNNQGVDAGGLSKTLGVPVVEISALKNKGIHHLMEIALKACESKRQGTTVLSDSKVEEARKIYEQEGVENPLFHAIKALESDELELEANKTAYARANELVKEEEFDAVSADERYKYITEELAKFKIGVKEEKSKDKLSISDKIDRVLTNRWAAIPIFLLALLLVFALTFSEDLFFLGRMGVKFNMCFEGNEFFEGLFWTDGGINSPGVILANLTNGITGWLASLIEKGLTAMHTPDWLVGMLMSVIADGFFAVIGFLPQILCLFFFFSLMEDSGYMARVAFVFDRIFRRAGLSGRAFIPMLMGYGCGVPAMVNTRTLNTDKERIQTIRVIAFFCCGAKVAAVDAVAAILASKAFGWNAALVGFAMYLLGLVVAIAMVILMHWTTQREKVPPFIMELPAYHAPQWRALGIHIWDKTKGFVKKASTIIVLAALLIWIFSNFTQKWQYIPDLVDQFGAPVAQYEGSMLKNLCQMLSPIFWPLGFGNNLVGEGWVMTLATITGLVAKEVVADTFITIAGGEAAVEGMVLATGIGLGGLLAFLVFNLLTVPCFAAVATAKAELPKGQLKWTILFWLGTSYVVALMVRLMFDFWWTTFIIVAIIAAIYVGAYFWYRRACKKEELK
nr:ferrous iron transporter B [Bacilli bacterium]